MLPEKLITPPPKPIVTYGEGDDVKEEGVANSTTYKNGVDDEIMEVARSEKQEEEIMIIDQEEDEKYLHQLSYQENKIRIALTINWKWTIMNLDWHMSEL